MRAIFISYRREDAEGQAGRLFDDLCEHFGSDAVFMDVAAIEPGRDFRRVIDEHVASCGVLLAVIGKSWLTARDAAGQRRLDEPADFVRLETASALKRDIPVVPVLVHGAKMPTAEELPDDLKELAFRNGVELTHARWDSDVQVLVNALRPYVSKPVAPQTAPVAARAQGDGSRRKAMWLAACAVMVTVAGVVAAAAWREHAASEAARIAAEADAQCIAAIEDERRMAAEKLRVAADEEAARRAKALAEAEARRKRLTEEAALKARVEQQARREAEAERLAAEARAKEREAKIASVQRARWKEGNFPAPNAGKLLYTITSSGDPACVSYNGGGCLWGMSHEQIDFSRIKPVVCGNAHKAMWGTTGYEDPKHWCSLARRWGAG